jgi:hypothetical protein
LSDTQLQESIKTIQQLLVEYGILLGGGPMEATEEDKAYDALNYVSLPGILLTLAVSLDSISVTSTP